MSDKPWKQFERRAGSLIGGKRFWANAGEALDCEGPLFVGQCKHVKHMTLTQLSDLAESVAKEAAPKFKAGVVVVQQRRGRGRTSPVLVVMTAETFTSLHGDGVSRDRRARPVTRPAAEKARGTGMAAFGRADAGAHG